MATKSILKNTDIKDKESGKALVIALENAAKKRTKDISLSKAYEDIRSEKLKDILPIKYSQRQCNGQTT